MTSSDFLPVSFFGFSFAVSNVPVLDQKLPANGRNPFLEARNPLIFRGTLYLIIQDRKLD